MKHGHLLCFGVFLTAAVGVCVDTPSAVAQSRAKSTFGTIAGFVQDSSGIPQLGATVELVSETAGNLAGHQLLTNPQGNFHADNVSPGLYTVRVTLAGFLPGLEKHVQVSSNLTTVVRVQLESLFASIEQLRRVPSSGTAEPDDWKWVLRSAASVRPVLQWREEDTENGSAVIGDTMPTRGQVGQVELTSGARRPGSVSNITGAPGTEFAYDQRIDGSNHLLFAGQVSYDEDAPAGGLAIVWMPTGALLNGAHSTMVFREAKVGPNGPVFRGVRLDQSGSMAFADRFLLRVGGEYVLVGANSPASSIRPRVDLQTQISQNWFVDVVYASLPTGVISGDNPVAELIGNSPSNALGSTMAQLDSFPAVLWRAGKPVLESGRHEELGLERKLGAHSLFQIAAFHDDNSHVALFGRGNDLPQAEYFQDFYSKGFAYDGGSSVSWGARAALSERIREDLELTTIYAFSGALVPTAFPEDALRDALKTMPRHSVAVKASGRVPATKTILTVGYKWVNGPTLSRVDPYSEDIYDVNPFLHVGIRQPLPWAVLGHWEASAECDNLLAQGYLPLNTRDGQVLLVPAFRSFRGGLSLQF